MLIRTYQSLHFPIFLPDCTVRRTLKNGLTTEEANAIGLSNGSELQVWAGPGSCWTLRFWKPFHCLSNAYTHHGKPLPSRLALNSPQLRGVDLIIMRLVHTRLDTSASWRKWLKGRMTCYYFLWAGNHREQKQCAAFKPLQLCYCWKKQNTDALPSKGLIAIIVQTWYCKQTHAHLKSCICFDLHGLTWIQRPRSVVQAHRTPVLLGFRVNPAAFVTFSIERHFIYWIDGFILIYTTVIVFVFLFILLKKVLK